MPTETAVTLDPAVQELFSYIKMGYEDECLDVKHINMKGTLLWLYIDPNDIYQFSPVLLKAGELNMTAFFKMKEEKLMQITFNTKFRFK